MKMQVRTNNIVTGIQRMRKSHGCQITLECLLTESVSSPNRFKMNRLGETLKDKVLIKEAEWKVVVLCRNVSGVNESKGKTTNKNLCSLFFPLLLNDISKNLRAPKPESGTSQSIHTISCLLF